MIGLSELIIQYRLRWKRRRLLFRALRKRRQLTTVSDNTHLIKCGDVLAAVTQRNEYDRLPFFLNHHRKLGIQHFLFVDNGSNDGSLEYLKDQPDVSVWATNSSYRLSRFGMDWLTWLQFKYAHDHWCLTLDADEIFIYPFHDTRPIQALTEWLDQGGRMSFGALMLDMYPKGPLGKRKYKRGSDPFKILNWFDRGNYMIQRQDILSNLWIQGGARARVFFADNPRRAPTMSKTPLVKWNRRYAYVSSSHSILPRHLNMVYDQDGGELTSGVLLHTKFLNVVIDKTKEELERRQHFQNAALYDSYYESLLENPILWCEHSSQYSGWRQLEAMGLMSKGTWL